jgi:cyanophycin synthetase
MLLENVNVLRGPNYWSTQYHQLIVMNVNITDRRLINEIPGFTERYRKLFGDCVFDDGGENMLLAEAIERTAGELQRLAGFETVFRKTVELKPGIYKIIFSHHVESAGKKIAEEAFHAVKAVICNISFHLQEKIKELKELIQSESLGPSTYSIYAEALKRGIPALRLDNGSYVQLGYGSAQKRFEATLTSQSSSIAVDRASNKHLTKQLLTDACIPVPKGIVIDAVEKLYEEIEELGYPIVIKPLDGNQGKGATINISNYEDAEAAFLLAKKFSRTVIIEQFVQGRDFRALVINDKFVAAAIRKPAAVTGNGINTIRELVDQINKDPRRGYGHCNVLTKITVDDSVHALLKQKNYTIDTIPAPGEEVLLRSTANLSTGGTAEDVTEHIHPSNISLFERIARITGLDICGIDLQAPDLSSPVTENGGAVIEVNAAPGFRMHLEPSSGQARNVAAPVIDMLFPDGNNGRIPIVAITGTNGKTTTTRLIARMVQQKGYSTGFTTTDGIYLNNELIYKGDCSGPASAKVILKDPSVEFAVLETARGGIIRSGLGFDHCSCAVVTNIAEDHLGLGGIETLEELARVKSVVAKSVMPSGYAVLNADDDLVYRMRNDVRCKVALFSLHSDNPRIEKHCEKGGIAAVYEEGYIMIREGNRLFPVEAVENIPLTHGGKALFNIENAMAATMAAYLSGIPLPAIRCTLRSFQNSPGDTPGRLNQFSLGSCHVLVDYAHNTHGLKALGTFISSLAATKKIGVITAVGDRRNEDIISLGEEAAGIFDEIIIRYDEDLRGRTELEIGSLLRSGIQQADPEKKVHYCADEIEAIDFALQHSVPDTLIVLLVENAKKVTEKLRDLQAQKQDAIKGIRMAG